MPLHGPARYHALGHERGHVLHVYPLLEAHVVLVRYFPVGHLKVEHHAQPLLSPAHRVGPDTDRYCPARQLVGHTWHVTTTMSKTAVRSVYWLVPQLGSCLQARFINCFVHARVGCCPVGHAGHV